MAHTKSLQASERVEESTATPVRTRLGGLRDEDVIELLKLVRKQTNDDILEIVAVGEEAEIQTGVVIDGKAKGGDRFIFTKPASGWELTERFPWTA